MKTKKVFLLLSLSVLAIMFFNLSLLQTENTKLVFSISSMQKALAEEEAGGGVCVSVTYFSKNMKSCSFTNNCYSSSYQVCGTQRCCESNGDPNSDCNELDCIVPWP